MVDLLEAGGKFLGSKEDPVAGKPIDAEEAESFVACPACGDMIDIRHLATVLAHLKPLPHSGQEQTN
jgi:hypothetical protein